MPKVYGIRERRAQLQEIGDTVERIRDNHLAALQVAQGLRDYYRSMAPTPIVPLTRWGRFKRWLRHPFRRAPLPRARVHRQ
jgi:hypothetical protein